MTNYIKNFIIKITSIEKYFLILLAFLPISMIIGNFFINLTLLLILILFIIDLINEKNFFFLRDNYFWFLIFFFFSLLINLCFSIDTISSLPRVLKITEIIALTVLLKKIITKYESDFENIIFGSWAIIFSILMIDIIFEIIFGFNTIGFKSHLPGRIASFFGDELIVGSFFGLFSLFYIARISSFLKKNKNIVLSFLIIFLVTISFLIGERSNFIKFFIISFFLYFFIIEINFKYKASGILLLLIILSLFFSFNESIKYRYYSQMISNFKAETKNIEKKDSKNFIINTIDTNYIFIKNSQYGAHYNAAYKIFLAHPYFGIGIKNFRKESGKDKYKNDEYKWTHKRMTTHPHQIHFEFLSETGLFGYVSFLIFILASLFLSIKNYLKFKNFYQLMAILYISASLIPLLPSGSFFSTYSSILFWINYAIMVSYIRKN